MGIPRSWGEGPGISDFFPRRAGIFFNFLFPAPALDFFSNFRKSRERAIARLCSRLGGHGQRATAPDPTALAQPRLSAAHCDSAWFGSWGSIWRPLRGWLPTLRGVSLAHTGDGAQLEFRASLASAFDRISTSLADVRAHEHIAMLPTGYSLPLIHTALIDGALRTPTPSMMMLL